MANRPGTGKGNWTYDPKKHIPALLEIFRNGGDIAQFCAKFNMSRTTYYDWKNNFPDFEEAIHQAREMARAWWEKQGRDNLCNPQFNTNAWRLMMRNRFDMTDTRCVSVPKMSVAKTRGGQHKLLSKAVEQGELTPDEALKLANFVAVGSKIDQVDDFEARLKAIEENVAANAS